MTCSVLMVWTTGVKTTTKKAVTKAGKAHLLTGWVVLDPGVQSAVQELFLSVDLLQESLGLNDLLRGRQPSLRTPPFSQSCRGHAHRWGEKVIYKFYLPESTTGRELLDVPTYLLHREYLALCLKRGNLLPISAYRAYTVANSRHLTASMMLT